MTDFDQSYPPSLWQVPVEPPVTPLAPEGDAESVTSPATLPPADPTEAGGTGEAPAPDGGFGEPVPVDLDALT